MAGGHNPRQVAASRLRQRVLHKFSYIPTQNPGLVGCTGCGRCVDLCPLDRHLFADVFEIMKRINQEANVLRDPLLPLPARISERSTRPPTRSPSTSNCSTRANAKPSAICPASSARSRLWRG